MKLSEDRTNFLGIPVSGEINEGSTYVNQLPKEGLAPLLSAVLEDPFIAECGWRQYTPYFNDGDVCEFSAGEVWFRTAKDAPATKPSAELEARVSTILAQAAPVLSAEDTATLKDLLTEAVEALKEEEEADEDEDEELYELTIDSHPVLGARRWTGSRYEDVERTPEVVATAEKCEALSKAIESGHFNMVLTEAFGDHCSITVTREGINISHYRHD